MKYLKQLAILFFICVAGDLFSYLLFEKIPGNVIGMILLFLLLLFGIIKLYHVEEVGDFFLKNMAFFFIPACLGILDVFSTLKTQLIPILLICFITTFLTAGVTAFTVHLVLKLQKKKQEVGKNE